MKKKWINAIVRLIDVSVHASDNQSVMKILIRFSDSIDRNFEKTPIEQNTLELAQHLLNFFVNKFDLKWLTEFIRSNKSQLTCMNFSCFCATTPPFSVRLPVSSFLFYFD